MQQKNELSVVFFFPSYARLFIAIGDRFSTNARCVFGTISKIGMLHIITVNKFFMSLKCTCVRTYSNYLDRYVGINQDTVCDVICHLLCRWFRKFLFRKRYHDLDGFFLARILNRNVYYY